MRRSTTTRSTVALGAAVALIAVIAVAATGVAGRSPAPSPAPSDAPSPAPSGPVATPVPTPTPVPSDPADGFTVDLDIADDHDVTVVVRDDSDDVTGVRSGKGKDGMSVRWGDIVARNVDADTIELTFAGWLEDEAIDVTVTSDGQGYALTVTQLLPYPNSDAMGGDRVLVIDFASAVDADDVTAEFVAKAR